ncbi:MAG: GTPase Era [Deltaproteobacteria bacterium]|nr:MAG: GTPase Era [Deltaproteobacteria bacterium]
MADRSDPCRSGFVALIGRSNVGKSTLLNRLIGQKIAITSSRPQTTRNRILGILSRPDGQILFLDTPGLHAARSRLNKLMVEQAREACREVDLILWLVEADRPVDDEPLVADALAQSGAPVVLVVNKSDLAGPAQLMPLLAAYGRLREFRAIVPVSALTGAGCDRLVEVVLESLPEGPRYYPDDQVTDLPERFIAAELIRERLLTHTRDEVPYGAAVQVESFEEDPDRNLVVIRAVIHVEREMHKRIVVGKGGSMIRRIGEEARHAIEGLLGVRVFLELFVRVQPGWTGSDRALREFGLLGE